MKYYLYISAPKVEMLFPQIPPTFLQGASAELKVNLGLLSTTIKGTQPENFESLSLRVAAVSKYLQAHAEVSTRPGSILPVAFK